MLIKGREYAAGQATARDAAEVALLLKKVNGEGQPFDLQQHWPEILDSASRLMRDSNGLPIGSDLYDMPLHEAIDAIHDFWEEWFEVNVIYAGELVAPAIERATATINGMTAAFLMPPDQGEG